ncbi:BTB/POZ domain-containing protein 6-like isoform X3 [Dreissena polymorpha]|uniref:BTB/POZ domain-containing protein 6-like isoform X3 n=1 Tax=Dreissena polymorpha TaxID=45954 RepID=UPI002264F666|nr:BTB/POZ domain-containing protein 6-like isoform X3 [Dreissena polymorpha]
MATDGSDWQSKHSKVTESNRYMLEHELDCDINFIVGLERKSMKAHKFMLVSRSCVFYAMLAGPLAEQQREVELPDVEPEAFERLLQYAQLKCQRLGLEETPENMRKEAGNALLHVRFPIMSSEYFSERVEPTGLLSEDQTMQLYRFFARKKTGDAGGFETKERMPMFVARRFKHVTSGWSYSGQREKVDAITFMCSRDIILKGVQLYGTDQGQGQLSVNIRLVQEPYRANMLNLHKVLETDGKEQVYSVLFEHPKTIKKDKQYSFEITIEGQNTFYGVEGQPVVESETVQFTFSDSAKSTNTTNTYRGQIPGIIFDMNKDQS